MRAFFSIAALIALLPAVIAAPTELLSVKRSTNGGKPNSYLVTLKDGSSRTAIVKKLKDSARTTIYEKAFFNGFAAEIDEEDLNLLRADPEVAAITEDTIVYGTAVKTQTNAPWNLQRISQAGKVTGAATSLTYKYKYGATGKGVDVYFIDTGINTAHVGFGGRARWGATFGGYADADGHGHGTLCAGIAGSSQFGVAKDINLIAVKVLSDTLESNLTDIFAGVNWAFQQTLTSGRPSIFSLSLATWANDEVDQAVAALTSAGIHVVVAAGNESWDVDNLSPARAPSAVTVTASTIDDAFASFSNFGAGVDLIAPGLDITSTFIGSTTATFDAFYGSSAAVPHVSGLIAYFIERDGNISPAEMSEKLKHYAVKNAISGVPSGTVNYLANNGL